MLAAVQFDATELQTLSFHLLLNELWLQNSFQAAQKLSPALFSPSPKRAPKNFKALQNLLQIDFTISKTGSSTVFSISKTGSKISFQAALKWLQNQVFNWLQNWPQTNFIAAPKTVSYTVFSISKQASEELSPAPKLLQHNFNTTITTFIQHQNRLLNNFQAAPKLATASFIEAPKLAPAQFSPSQKQAPKSAFKQL
ncbi:hypothetical protein WMY93_001899 [Mugilogobius chulae]|uniref:Uncharacterized protein n=1 Tax=Mugilogobius chulae TaxID=88201 RepID=A0AAW0PS94_9GOBI